MNIKRSLLFFLLFLCHCRIMGQDDTAQLPFSKNNTYPKESTTGIVLAKMVDELGHKFYWATDTLLDDTLKQEFNSNNLPRLLLKGAYLMSENIANLTLENDIKKDPKTENISFEAFRKNTLSNLKKASTQLITNESISFTLDWDRFMKLIAIADSYCDEIISFRENMGRPFKPNNDLKEEIPSKSKMFEQSIGADGVTTKQWMKIMERGGGQNGADIIRNVVGNNQKIIIALKKEERPTVTTGNLETIKSSSNIVDGLTYTSFNIPPEQLSYVFSNDQEFMKGITNWIIYINSGNPIKLSEMFRVGLDIAIDLHRTADQSLVSTRYREIVDREGSKVKLEFSKKFFDKTRFSDISINAVHIYHEDQIEFFGAYNEVGVLHKNSHQLIILLKNIEGDLLEKIKMNINQMREGSNEYNEDLVNLKKY